MGKVGIVILNYNASDILNLTLDSMIRTSIDVLYKVCLVDNGSEAEDCKKAHMFFEVFKEKHGTGEDIFIDLKENKGFSGGNNVGLKRLLEDSDITHICLLNSDVILTDRWLDTLIFLDKDVVGPVTNAAGNEQTIAVDFQIEQNEGALSIVNKFAQKRNQIFKDLCKESEIVTFFATLFKRQVIEVVGELDERFFPGSFEDDDYCLRILNAGFKIWVARGCFIYHWGSGSFANLAMDYRVSISRENKARFEEKWGKKWENRQWKLLESCRQDAEYLATFFDEGNGVFHSINKSFLDLEDYIDELVQYQENSMLQNENYNNRITYLSQQNMELQQRLNSELPIKENFKQIYRKIKRRFTGEHWKNHPYFVRKREKKDRHNYYLNLEKQILNLVSSGTDGNKGAMCIITPIFNDVNITDGYFQRVKAIDEEILTEYYKVYINLEQRIDQGDRYPGFHFNVIDKNHLEIVMDPNDEEELRLLLHVLEQCKGIYIHSVLKVMKHVINTPMRELIFAQNIPVIWDVHGSVPEEFALYGDYYGAQLAGEAEEFLISKAKIAVAVNFAMKEHLEEKYKDIIQTQIIVMPIFNSELVKIINCEKEKVLKKGQHPIAVYAGGLQKWQNISRMQETIEAAGNICRYKMFVPRPEEFIKEWGAKKYPEDIEIERKTPQELSEEYRHCHYGFVLRDNITVNNVACPTKIIEYIQYGILPVLDTAQIGDFAIFGMKYLDYRDFKIAHLPNEKDRQVMVGQNYEILQKLVETYLNGKKMIKESI